MLFNSSFSICKQLKFAGCIVKNNYHENRFFVLNNMMKKAKLFLDTGQTILKFAGK